LRFPKFFPKIPDFFKEIYQTGIAGQVLSLRNIAFSIVTENSIFLTTFI